MIRIFRTAFRIALSDNRKSKIKNRKLVGLSVIAVMLLVLGAMAEAQQPKKVARICYLGNAVSGRQAIYIKMFRERLRELGYVEGQNITIEYRDFEGKVERLPDLAAELVRLNCDVIVTQGNEAAEAAKNATKTIPVVMAFGADAVKLGIVADLARPGGNITGLTFIGSEIFGKRLELLKETVPKLARVAFLWSDLSQRDELKEVETAARILRVEFQSLEVKGPDDFEGAFRAAIKGRAEWSYAGRRRVLRVSRKTDHRSGGKESASSDVYCRSVCRGRRTDVLWGGSFRDVPARRRDRG